MNCNRFLIGPVGLPGGGIFPEPCRIIDADRDTFVSVCNDNVILGQTNRFTLIGAEENNEAPDIVDPANANIFYTSTNNGIDGEVGAIRVGSFTTTNFQNMGDYSAAFGLNVQASGDGALAHGIATNGALLDASGAGSQAHGVTDGVGSSIEARAIGSDASGNTLADGNIIVFAGSDGSTAEGRVQGPAAIQVGPTPSFGSEAAGSIINNTTGGTVLIAATGSGSEVRGNVLANAPATSPGIVAAALQATQDGVSVHGNVEATAGAGIGGTLGGSTVALIGTSGDADGSLTFGDVTATGGAATVENLAGGTASARILSVGDGALAHGDIISTGSASGAGAVGILSDATISANRGGEANGVITATAGASVEAEGGTIIANISAGGLGSKAGGNISALGGVGGEAAGLTGGDVVANISTSASGAISYGNVNLTGTAAGEGPGGNANGSITASGTGSHSIGNIVGTGGLGAIGIGTGVAGQIISAGPGSYAGGDINMVGGAGGIGAAGTISAIIRALDDGSEASGNIDVASGAGGDALNIAGGMITARIQAGGEGSMVKGSIEAVAGNGGAVAGGDVSADIMTTADGSFALGFIGAIGGSGDESGANVTADIRSIDDGLGGLAKGYIEADAFSQTGPINVIIEATGLGATAGGAAFSNATTPGDAIIRADGEGAFVHGVARGGEVLEAMFEASTAIGRDTSVSRRTEPENAVITPSYSLSMGINSQAYLRASLAHAAFPEAEKGVRQYMRLLVYGNSAAVGGGATPLFTSDTGNTRITLPDNTRALVTIDVIGSRSSAVKAVFQIENAPGLGGYALVGPIVILYSFNLTSLTVTTDGLGFTPVVNGLLAPNQFQSYHGVVKMVTIEREEFIVL